MEKTRQGSIASDEAFSWPGTTSPADNAPFVDHMTQRWQDALKHCEKELGAEDFAYIMSFESPETLMAEIDRLIAGARNAGIPRFLRQLKPHVEQMQTFILGVLLALKFSSLESVCIWGLITLMLQLAERSEEFLSLITQMWSDIGNNLQVFDVYKEHIGEDPGLGLILFEVLEELQKFAVFTVRSLTKAPKANFSEPCTCLFLLSAPTAPQEAG